MNVLAGVTRNMGHGMACMGLVGLNAVRMSKTFCVKI